MATRETEPYDLESMDDAEIRDLILQELEEQLSIEAGAVEVEVEGGKVMLSGRVGTENELESIERVILDRIGVEDLENGMVVDELVRREKSEAADEAAVEGDQLEGKRRVRGDATEPSAEHLVEDVEGDLYGTEDLQKAIEQGESYSPPDRPHDEGTRSLEDH